MELFKNRPFAFICFLSVSTMIAFLYLTKSLRVFFILAFAVALVVSVILFVILKKRHAKQLTSTMKKLICCIIYIVISLILIVETHIFISKSEYISTFKDENTTVVGTVTDIRYRSNSRSCFETVITSINNYKTEIKAILEIPSYSSLKTSDTFSSICDLSPLSLEDDYYLISDGFNGRITCESKSDLRIKSTKIGSTEPLFSRINAAFQSVLNEKTDESTGAFAGALLLGNRDGLADETLRDFRRSGISHMLALSGLHMSIIIGFFDLVMRNMFIDKKIRCILLIFLSLAYLAVTGFAPSASRAVIMLCIVYISYLINNEAESITSLFIALILILIFSPYAIYDVGLWMSFFATLGIIVVSEISSAMKYHIKKKPLYIQILIKLTLSVLLTLAAVFSTCIFSWVCFGEISIVSPLTNLIFSPIMTAILVLGLLTVIFSPIPVFSVLFGKSLVFMSSLFIDLASYVSHWHNITVSLKYDFTPFIMIPLVLSLVIFLVIKLPRKWMIAIPPALAVIAFSISLYTYNSLNDGKASVIYIKEKRNETLVAATVSDAVICDISSGGYSNLYNACEIAMNAPSITEMEGIVLSHYHSYHIKSLERICNKYLVRRVYLPLPETDEEWKIYDEICIALQNARTDAVTYKKGITIDFPNGVEISVSDNEYIKRSTHPIFSVLVSNDTKSLAYSTSAITESSDLSIVKNSDILILGSHGPTVKSLTNESIFTSASKIPQTLVFSSPKEMLADKDFLLYVHKLYQNGHTVILDGREICNFELN